MRGIRLLPIVMFATASLLVLKVVGILASGGYTLGGSGGAFAQSVPLPAPQPPDLGAPVGASAGAPVPFAARPAPLPPNKRSWAQEMLGYPDITGSAGGSPPPAAGGGAAPPAAKNPENPPKTPDGTPVVLDDKPQISAGERAVLERLQERRQELENRSRELDIREGLLRAAEKRLEARIDELKQLETQVVSATQKKDEAEAARFKGLISMYENMKAKEAARIFDRLDQRVLLDVASQINPRRMSDILAQMSPEVAERLTVELASRANQAGKAPAPSALPKIEGRPRS